MCLSLSKDGVINFLINNEMYHGEINFKKETQKFTDAMEDGLRGKASSLKMIPAFIDPSLTIKNDKKVIAIDAGGTNFRRALVSFHKEGMQMEDFAVYPMPGIKNEIGREDFFGTILQYLEPILDESELFGFCFSYPAEILPWRDGKIISLTKEIKVTDISGVEIGREINKHIKKRGFKTYSVMNDTTACLLSGKTMNLEKKYDSYISLILGTGTNTCYIEKNENIRNNAYHGHEGQMLINLESGGYSGIHNGKIDQLFDETTVNPGEYIFEKMSSGAYLGPLILEVLKVASQQGLFTSAFSESILKLETLSSIDVSNFFDNMHEYDNVISTILTHSGTAVDQKTVYEIIDNLMERSAKILSINLCGILCKVDKGKNPEKPVCIVIEGSTFYGSSKYQDKFDRYRMIIKEKYGYHTERIKVKNASLLGSAIGALLYE